MSDVSLSVSEAAFEAVYNGLATTPPLPFDGAAKAGPLSFSIEGALHIAGAGDIDFEDSDSFWVDELKFGWDKLVIRLGFDIPTVTIGRFCVLRVPDDSPFLAGECLFEFPGGELFGGDPDIGPVKINLNAIIAYVVTEISGRFNIVLQKDGTTLKLVVRNESIDVDPISIQDTFGKLPWILKGAIAVAAAKFIASNPSTFLLDTALGILGFPSVTELLLDILDIEDDVQEWLTKWLNIDIGIQNLIAGVVVDALKDETMFDIPDPYGFLPANTIDVADFGAFTDPQPAGTSVALAVPRAEIIDPEAHFDDDNLHIRFNLAV